MNQNTYPKIVSGNGESTSTPVLFESCDVATRVAAEYGFICDKYGAENTDWSRGIHITRSDFEFGPSPLAELFETAAREFGMPNAAINTEVTDRSDVGPLSQWSIELADGRLVDVYFDSANTIYNESE